MRIIINVKYRAGRITLETRMDSGTKDKVVEMNAGKALYDAVNGMLANIGNPKDEKERLIGAIVAGGFTSATHGNAMAELGVATFTGNQHGESWAWDRAALETKTVEQLEGLLPEIAGVATLSRKNPPHPCAAVVPVAEPPALHCPFCGVELTDQTGVVLGDGAREWMCNVCGETGRMEEPA